LGIKKWKILPLMHQEIKKLGYVWEGLFLDMFSVSYFFIFVAFPFQISKLEFLSNVKKIWIVLKKYKNMCKQKMIGNDC
jgi:hypothetical protein